VGLTAPVSIKPQCPLANYPSDLDRVEYMRYLGEFHIAGTYTVNHDRDNTIHFLPEQEGFIKILVQAPSLDLEVAITDANMVVLAVAHNEPSLIGDLDYASLRFRVGKDRIGLPHYLVFKAENFTAERINDQCLEVYIEIIYDFEGDECEHNKDISESLRRSIIRVDDEYSF
jgi:hypothetical protein